MFFLVKESFETTLFKRQKEKECKALMEAEMQESERLNEQQLSSSIGARPEGARKKQIVAKPGERTISKGNQRFKPEVDWDCSVSW
jgi:hypothetical protein